MLLLPVIIKPAESDSGTKPRLILCGMCLAAIAGQLGLLLSLVIGLASRPVVAAETSGSKQVFDKLGYPNKVHGNDEVHANEVDGNEVHGNEVIGRWSFSRSEDVDFDGWPEGWARKQDKDHPAYVRMQITSNDEAMLRLAQALDMHAIPLWERARRRFPQLPPLPPSVADAAVGRHFRIEMDGGQAMVQSQELAVDPLFRYRLELSAKTEALKIDHAYAELVFFDKSLQVISQHATNSITGTTHWRSLRSEIVSAPPGASTIAVRLYVRPIKSDGEMDIRGSAGFDEIVVRQLPQMRIDTDQRLAIYDVGQRPQISIRVLGLNHKSTDVHLSVLDVHGRKVTAAIKPFKAASTPRSKTAANDSGQPLSTLDGKDTSNLSEPLTQSEPLENPELASTDVMADSGERDHTESGAVSSMRESVATWELPELPPGFYRIICGLGDPKQPTLTSETTFAILSNLSRTTADESSTAEAGRPSPFGWTLPADRPEGVGYKRIPEWLLKLGVRVVKYPCWLEPNDRVQLDETAWLVGRLQEKNIRMIGMLDHPPQQVLVSSEERERRDPVAANYFRDSAVWQPALEPIMTRLSLKIRTWQLGSEGDYSFLGRPELKQTIKDIGRELQGFGQPIGLALSWPWLEPQAPIGDRSWVATNLSINTPLAAEELDAYLQATTSAEPGARSASETWVSLNPLPKNEYDQTSRLSDLVLRMAMVRGHDVNGAFITKPTDPAIGLLRPDWRPDEMLVPWRTTAMLIGDLTRVGSLPLRKGSSSMVLSNPKRTTILVWNSANVTEQVYLGDKVRQIDVWGKAVTPTRTEVDGKPTHLINVGPIPTFLVDVDPVLVAFRMSTLLVEKNLDSLLGRRQSVSLQFNNPTRDVVSGEVRLLPRDDWEVERKSQTFDLSPGRVANHTFDVLLRNSATVGDTQLEFDFLLRTQPPRRFSVIRNIRVGPEGLDIEVTTRMSGDDLLVQLSMTNRTSVDQKYDCMMFPPGGRQYQRRQIVIPKGVSVERLFPWTDGQSLIGQKMLLRAVEQNGERVLNYPFVANP